MQRSIFRTPGRFPWLCAALVLIGCYDELIVADVTPLGEETPSDTDGSGDGTNNTEEDGQDDDLKPDPPVIDCGNRVWNYGVTIDDLLSEERDFSDITHIRGHLNISDPQRTHIGFADLSELRNLRCVDASIYIASLPYLKNLDDLSELKKIEGDLIISNNGSLDDMSGLHGVDYFGGDIFYIGQNPDLSTCDAIEFKSKFPYLDLNDETKICISLNKSDCPGDTSGCQQI